MGKIKMYETEIKEIESDIFVLARQLQNNLNMLNARIQDLKRKLEKEEKKRDKNEKPKTDKK